MYKEVPLPASILIVKTSSLGDIIQAFNVLDDLHNRFPTVAIDWAVEASFISIVAAHPLVRKAIALPIKKRGSLWAAFKELRGEKYDLIFDLQGNCKSGAVTLLARGKVKVGYALQSVREWPNVLATQVRFNVSKQKNIRNYYLSLIEQYFNRGANSDIPKLLEESGICQGGALNLSQRSGAEGSRGPQKSPRFLGMAVAAKLKKFSAGVPKEASSLGWGAGGSQIQWLSDAGRSRLFRSFRYIPGVRFKIDSQEERKIASILAEIPGRMKIMVCPGSKWANKQLKLETWIVFLKKIEEKMGAGFLLIWGDEAEKDLCKQIQSQVRSVLVDKLSIPTWQNLMNEVDLVIALDSSALHLCGTTSTPSFSIFGPTSPDVFKPIGNKHFAIQGACPYNRTFEKQCPLLRSCPTGACIKELKVQELFEAFQSQCAFLQL